MLVNLIAFDAMSDALAQLVTSAEVRVKGSARLNQWTRGDEVCAGINVVVESMTALDAAPRRKDHRPTERQTRRWARA